MKSAVIQSQFNEFELFKVISQNSDAGIIYYSAVRDDLGEVYDFRYEFINQTAYGIFPHLNPDFIGTTFLDHYKKEEMTWLDTYKEVIKNGSPLRVHLEFKFRGQTLCFVDKLIKHNDGLIIYFYEETDKIKLSKQLEEKNHELQSLLEKKGGFFYEVLNKAFDGVLFITPIFNNDGEIVDFKNVFANQSGIKTLKTTREFLSSHTFLGAFAFARENGSFERYKDNYLNNTSFQDIYEYHDDKVSGWFKVDSFRYDEGVLLFFRDESTTMAYEKKIEQQNKDLKLLLQQKDILFKETHHRVKNNLQIISSLLNLQSRSIKDSESLESFRISMQRIKTMALIHEKLYEGKNFEEIQLESFLKDMIDSIKRFYDSNKNIRFVYNVEDICLSIATCINLGLILNELIINSIKHAFRDRKKCEIRIDTSLKDKNLELIFSDNGSGLPDDFDFDNLTSLGLTIVKVLTDQLDGTLSVKNNSGAAFHLVVPI